MSGRKRACVRKQRVLVLSPSRPIIALAIAACFSGATYANPTAPTVVHGSASFATAGNVLNITNSPNAIINWGSFSIGVNELTRFIQQSGSSSVLNRVIGQDPSAILGALQSNGRVFLINPNGIVFGAGSQINVAGLVASTLNLSNDDFLANRMRFTDGAVSNNALNQGVINSPSVYLIGKAVTNDGLITSPKGEVILAAGNSVELVNPGTPNLRVEIVAPDNAARNLGTITADAGRIGIYAGLIRNSGTLRADTAVMESGRIILKATNKVELADGSVLSAAAHNGGNGGFIETSADQVSIADSAVITTAAAPGSTGTWLIDPTDFTIAASGGDITGSTLSTQLGANNVMLQTVATGGGNGDLFVNDTVAWANSNTLTLSAHRNIDFSGGGTLNGGSSGNVTLTAGTAGSGAIIGHASNTIITGNTLIAQAVSGIGSSGTPLKTRVANAALTNTGSGGIYATNTGDITVAAASTDGDIVVRTTNGANGSGSAGGNPGQGNPGQAGGTLIIGAVNGVSGVTTTGSGDITLTAGNGGNGAAGQNRFAINANGEFGGSGGNGGTLLIHQGISSAGGVTASAGAGGAGGAGGNADFGGDGGSSGSGGNATVNAAIAATGAVAITAGNGGQGANGGGVSFLRPLRGVGLAGNGGTGGMLTSSVAGVIHAGGDLTLLSGHGGNGGIGGRGYDAQPSSNGGLGGAAGAINLAGAVSIVQSLQIHAGAGGFGGAGGSGTSINVGGGDGGNGGNGGSSGAITLVAALNAGHDIIVTNGNGSGGGGNGGSGTQGGNGGNGGSSGAITVSAALHAGRDIILINGNGNGSGGTGGTSLFVGGNGGNGGSSGAITVNATLDAVRDMILTTGGGGTRGSGGGGIPPGNPGAGGNGGTITMNAALNAAQDLRLTAGIGGSGGTAGNLAGSNINLAAGTNLTLTGPLTPTSGNVSLKAGMNAGNLLSFSNPLFLLNNSSTDNLTLQGHGISSLATGYSANILTITTTGNIGSSGTPLATSANRLALQGGDVYVSNNKALTLAASSASGAFLLDNGANDITLAGTVSAAGSGDALRLAGARFINNAGAAALAAPNGRWIVWSQTPVNNAFGGLQSGNTAVWSSAYPGGANPTLVENGNRFAFSAAQPAGVAVVRAEDQSKIYGDTFTSFTYTAFDASGGSAYGNAFTDAGSAITLAGTPTLASAGAINTATRSGGNGGGPVYDITVDLTGVSAAGYTLQGSNGLLTVHARNVAVAAEAKNIVYGDAVAPLTFVATNLAGFDNNASAFTGALTRATGATSGAGHESAGSRAITQGTLAANANYNLTGYTGSTYTIAPKTLTAGATGQNKVYDATAAATVTYTDNRLSNDVLTVTGSSAFTDKNVANGKTVNVSGIALSGADAGNYAVNTAAATTADITGKTLTVTYGGVGKTYDATTSATVSTSDDRLGADVLNINRTAVFANQNVGTGIAVNVSGIALSGADAGNYTLNATSAMVSADITPALLTVRADDKTKFFQDPLSPYSATLTGFVGGEGVGVLSGMLLLSSSAAADSAIGHYAITPSGYSSSNYAILFVDGKLQVIPQTVPANNALISATQNSAPDGLLLSGPNLPGVSGSVSPAGDTSGCRAVGPNLTVC